MSTISGYSVPEKANQAPTYTAVMQISNDQPVLSDKNLGRITTIGPQMMRSKFLEFLLTKKTKMAVDLITRYADDYDQFFELLELYADGWHKWNEREINLAFIKLATPDDMSLQDFQRWTLLYLFDCRFRWFNEVTETHPQIVWNQNFWLGLSLNGDRLIITAQHMGLLPSIYTQTLLQFMYLNKAFINNEWQIRELESAGVRLHPDANVVEHFSLLSPESNAITSNNTVGSLIDICQIVLAQQEVDGAINLGGLNFISYSKHKDQFNAFLLVYILREIWEGKLSRAGNHIASVAPDIFCHITINDEYQIEFKRAEESITKQDIQVVAQIIRHSQRLGSHANAPCFEFINISNLSRATKTELISELLPIHHEELTFIEG